MHDIVVVGGGPAGLTAALYAARAGRSVLVVEQSAPGGQIVYSPLVENYPGLPGMSGAQFSRQLTEQVEALGVELEYAAVSGFSPGEGGYVVETEGGPRPCRALVLAPGSAHRHLGLAGEEELTGLGVSYCAVCDGPFYQGGTAAVVGGGDTALQDALFLSNLCRKVTLIHRREQFRGEARLVQRVRERDNIELLLGWAPEEFLRREDGSFAGLSLRQTAGEARRELEADGVFIAVGQQPGTAPFAGQVEVDAVGYFAAGEDCRTRMPGVFAAGDCRAKGVRQLTTAVGDGAAAAMAAVRFIEEQQG